MPRPKEKPPTEGGRIVEINKEFARFVDLNPKPDNIFDKLAKIYSFFVKKLAEKDIEIDNLNQKIEELSNK